MSNTDHNELKTFRVELDRLTQIIGEHRALPKSVLNLPFAVLHKLEPSATHMQDTRIQLLSTSRLACSVWGTSPTEPRPCPK
eukprot:2462056-Amphidinium_carterae.1